MQKIAQIINGVISPPVYYVGSEFTPEQAAEGNGLEQGTWRVITDAEAAELQKPTLDEAKAAKLTEISTAFVKEEESGHLMSSLGFEIDATTRANRDTEGLITAMTATATESTAFCDYDNVMRVVTLADVQTMRLEIIAHGQALYAKKWQLRSAVEQATTQAEVDAIQWDAPEGTEVAA